VLESGQLKAERLPACPGADLDHPVLGHRHLLPADHAHNFRA
jgi:hypothetical protein